jgi:hypothetical protein
VPHGQPGPPLVVGDQLHEPILPEHTDSAR